MSSQSIANDFLSPEEPSSDVPDRELVNALSSEQMDRIARQIAIGEFSLFEAIDPRLQEPLLQLVHGIRRKRLVNFIAGAIAFDIQRDRQRKESQK